MAKTCKVNGKNEKLNWLLARMYLLREPIETATSVNTAKNSTFITCCVAYKSTMWSMWLRSCD